MENIDVIIKKINNDLYEARIPMWPQFVLRRDTLNAIKASLPAAISAFDESFSSTQFSFAEKSCRDVSVVKSIEKSSKKSKTPSDSDIWQL